MGKIMILIFICVTIYFLSRLLTVNGDKIGTNLKQLKWYGVFVLFFIVINSSIFTVKETENVVISRFGKITKIYVTQEVKKEVEEEINKEKQFKGIKVSDSRGVQFKMPFIDVVDRYDNRLLTYDTNPCDVITGDKKKLVVDNFAQWRITNPLLFKITMKNITNAHLRIDDILYSKVREKISLIEAEELIGNKELNEKLFDEIKNIVNKDLKVSSGIEIYDIRIKHIMLPSENMANIFNRMISEREQMAKKYRSEGEEEYLKITSNAQKEATIIEAEAYEKAQKIKGEGDAEATKIYNEAFNKDAEFYSFYRTMQSYKKTINDKTMIVIPSDSEFAKYLFKAK